MAAVTVTNVSGASVLGAITMNDPDVVDTQSVIPGNPAGLLATGGNLLNPLPHPFDQVDALADTVAITRGMHVSDFRRQHNLWRALDPADEWNLLVNKGAITVAAAAEAGRTDVEEEEFGTI